MKQKEMINYIKFKRGKKYYFQKGLSIFHITNFMLGETVIEKVNPKKIK